MTSKLVRDILNKRFERHESVLLPKHLKQYLIGERRMDDQLMSMISFWLGHLESRMYKTSKRRGDASYEFHMDRVLLFLQYAKEHSHKDGALIMTSYRFLFPYADLYLKLKQKRIAVSEEGWSITKTLTSTSLKEIRILLTIKSQLDEQGIRLTKRHSTECWKEYITRTQGKAPGKVATSNFHKRLDNYLQVLSNLQELERSWLSVPCLSVAT